MIRRRAARTWEDHAARGGRLRGEPDAPSSLRMLLEDVAERVFGLTVVTDDTLAGTNIEGELNKNDGLVLLRPGL